MAVAAPHPTAPKGGKGIKVPKGKLPHGGKGPARGRQPKAPNWMAPLTPRKVSDQARTTITKAYAPAFQDLDQQAKQAQGLSDKRTADNKYYQAWLDSHMQALQSHADAAHQHLEGLQQDLTNQQNQLYSGQAGTLIGDANARAGNVSNESQSTAFGSTLAQNQAANEGLLGGASRQALEGIDISNHQLAATSANNTGIMQASQQKQLADLQQALTKIGAARMQLGTRETADIAKEIARLQGVEIQKAQSNRDFGAAMQKLSLQRASTQSLIQSRAASTALGQARLKLDLSKAQLAQMNSDRTFKLNQAKFDSQTAKDMYLRDHNLGPYKPGRGGGPKPLSPQSQNAIYARISKVRGELETLIGAGYSPEKAWHILHHGGYVATPAGANGKPGKKFFPAIGDDGLLNAAYNSRSGAGGLTPGDVAYLRKLGLLHPGQRLPVRPNASTPTYGVGGGGT